MAEQSSTQTESIPDGAGDVDLDGVHVPRDERAVFDVLIEGRRVWSFDAGRDAKENSRDRVPGHRLVPWPRELRRLLRGTGHVVVREHIGSRVLYDAEFAFDSSDTRTQIIDGRGRPMAVDKAGALQSMFATRGKETIDALLDGVLEVIRLLREEAGLPAFLAYGGLLGAIREGKLIAHDFDADVGYLSAHRYPVDVARESFALERIMRRGGFQTLRLSAADFKVLVPDPEGGRAIDIFGGFVVDDTLYLMPEVHTPFRESMILPIGEVELEGRKIPAPADPEALLEATYGPSWRVPDPTFKFTTPPSVKRRLESWMRGTMRNRGYWAPFYRGRNSADVPEEPSPFARWVGEREPNLGMLVDVGSGTGRDSLWFARQGSDVLGLDYIAAAVERGRRISKRDKLSAQFRTFNLYDIRQVLTTGAELAHHEKQPTLYGRFLLHALTDVGRHNLWRLASMSLRRGGHLYLEFRTGADAGKRHEFGEHYRQFLDPNTVVAEIESRDGQVEYREEGHGMAVYKDEDPHVCRLVVSWKR